MKILIGVPAYNFQIHSGVLMSLYKIPLQTKHEIKFMSVSVPCIPQARNTICKEAMEHKMDYILFWDADIEVLKKNFLDQMVELSRKNKDAIVCAPYLMKLLDKKQFNIIKIYQDEFEYYDVLAAEPFEVDAGGTGLMLIPTKILEHLDKPYFRMIIRNEDFIPEDWDFCLRAKEKGIKTIIDPSIGTSHWGMQAWTYNP